MAKKVAKKDQSITQRGVKKKSNLKRALKNTAKGIGTGVAAVASVSPMGTKAKALKIAGKVYKVAKNKLKRRAINKAMKKGGRDGIIKSKLPSAAFERRLRKEVTANAKKEYGTVAGKKWAKGAQGTGAIPKKGKMGIDPMLKGIKTPSNKKSYARTIKHEQKLERLPGKNAYKNEYSNHTRAKTINALKNNPSAKMAKREIARRKDRVDTYKKAKAIKKIIPKAVGLGIGAGGVAAYKKKVPNKGKKNGSF